MDQIDLYRMCNMCYIMCNKKEYFISFRVTLEEYSDISKLAAKLEGGNISQFARKTFMRMIENGRERGLI